MMPPATGAPFVRPMAEKKVATVCADETFHRGIRSISRLILITREEGTEGCEITTLSGCALIFHLSCATHPIYHNR